jgi:hypothetical protein
MKRTPPPPEKRLTSEQWDTATTEQRQYWLDNDYLVMELCVRWVSPDTLKTNEPK